MSEDAARDVPFVQSVFHPSDFSEASLNAFAHALVLALVRQTEFTLLHVGREYLAEDEWSKFPPIRRTLEHWGLLDEGSALLIDPDDAPAIARAIEACLAKPDAAADRVACARGKAAHWSAPEMARRFEDVYRTCLSRRRR